jgi:hypothetical protein
MTDERSWRYGPNETDWEALTQEQAITDAHLVREFEYVQGRVAAGQAIDAETCARLEALAATLSPRRAAHWRAEFERVGVAVGDAAQTEQKAAVKQNTEK